MKYDGTWDIVMKTPMGDREAQLLLEQRDDEISGFAVAEGNKIEIKNGKVEDGRAKFEVDLTSPMPLTLKFDVVDEGEDLGGTVELGMFGSSSVKGTKV